MGATYFFGTMEFSGTGFVVTHDDPRRPGTKGLAMVTTAHLLEQAGKQPVFMAVRMRENKDFQPLALLRLETEESGELRFARHPKHDVAAFMVEIPEEVANILPQPGSAPEAALSIKEPATAGREVGFLGFPEVFPGTPGGFPILRSGKIASNATGELSREKTFVVNADVYAGDSGAPVFGVDSHGKLMVAGMVTERIGATPETFSHFAVAVDASAVRETLGLLDKKLQEPRKQKKITPEERRPEPLPIQPEQNHQAIVAQGASTWLYPFSIKTRTQSLRTASTLRNGRPSTTGKKSSRSAGQ